MLYYNLKAWLAPAREAELTAPERCLQRAALPRGLLLLLLLACLPSADNRRITAWIMGATPGSAGSGLFRPGKTPGAGASG